MILTCPQCVTRYQVDEAKFPPGGRTVRCGKCRHIWHQFAVEPQPKHVFEPQAEPKAKISDRPDLFANEKAPPGDPTISMQPRFGAHIAEQRSSFVFMPVIAIAGWGTALIAIILLFAPSVIHYETDHTKTRPRSGSFLLSASQRIEMQGVDLRNVGYQREIYGGQTMLVLSGTIFNNTNRTLPVPKAISVTLNDENNNQLFSATIPANIATLGPGESVVFRTRIHDLPATRPRLQMALHD